MWRAVISFKDNKEQIGKNFDSKDEAVHFWGKLKTIISEFQLWLIKITYPQEK